MLKEQGSAATGKAFNKRALLKVTVSLVALGLLVWQAVLWHCNGTHLTIFRWTGTGKVCLAVLYNLGLIAAVAAAMGFLLGGLNDIFRPKHRDAESPAPDKKDAAR